MYVEVKCFAIVFQYLHIPHGQTFSTCKSEAIITTVMKRDCSVIIVLLCPLLGAPFCDSNFAV